MKIEHSGVSSVDFSSHRPSLLAVGMSDGTIALYDIRVNSSTPALKSSIQSGGQHTATVWEVQWIDKGKERGETLVSIGSDGRAVEWHIKKGLEHSNLMRLKRVPTKTQSMGAQLEPQRGAQDDDGGKGKKKKKKKKKQRRVFFFFFFFFCLSYNMVGPCTLR
eukprot:NODE_1528_length_584_cov_487.400000_g1227_i0.p1 GENE.NODE_1528_length_584_cov_487.400000_g1227_i0~~NODE_1528_length_584_cov_487.400000_g1227_i0.p1  ORF type:complete len:163 (-),score=60.62 NODE_1528_length_584_cov_487.400000_g1227_i0:2-490(-)